MSSRLFVSSDRLYRLLLRSYPAEFQRRFAAEMAQVFRMVCLEVYAEAGLAGLGKLWILMLWDWAWAAMDQWRLHLFKRKAESMLSNPIDHPDGIAPLSRAQAGLAVLPFLLFGMSILLGRTALFSPGNVIQLFGSTGFFIPYLIFVGLTLVGLFTSLISGFPRWGTSYLGWTILVGWLQFGMFRDQAGQLFWLLVVGLVLVALLVRRSFQPLLDLLTGLWQDWTMLSFAIYLLYSFVFMLYDENHNPYLYILMTASILSVGLGAWGYFRASTPLRRILSLMGGLLLAVVISIIDSLTWDFAAYYHLPKSTTRGDLAPLVFFAGLALIMAVNGLLAYWRSRRKTAVLS